MSYVDRMCCRMMVGCLMPIGFAILAAYVASTLLALPASLGRQAKPSDIPLLIGLVGAGLSFLLFALQGVRLWRWRLGKTDDCFVCGCLLGHEREGRWGLYRKCLGCGKNHSFQG